MSKFTIEKKLQIMAEALAKAIHEIDFLTSLIARLEARRMTDDEFKEAIDDVCEKQKEKRDRKYGEDIPVNVQEFVDGVLARMRDQ